MLLDLCNDLPVVLATLPNGSFNTQVKDFLTQVKQVSWKCRTLALSDIASQEFETNFPNNDKAILTNCLLLCC